MKQNIWKPYAFPPILKSIKASELYEINDIDMIPIWKEYVASLPV